MSGDNQTEGRKGNAAQPLGERAGLVDKAGARRTAAKEQRSAGPDGPDARATTEAIRPKSK